jgi:arsenate reductase
VTGCPCTVRRSTPVSVAAGHRRGEALEIWINPACSKCGSALSLLDDEGVQYTVRRYLDDPPTAAELGELLDRLGLEPWDITRTGESVADTLGLAAWDRDPATRERWIEALARHPVLIQRPIITADDGTAVVARSQEAVRSVLPRSW